MKVYYRKKASRSIGIDILVCGECGGKEFTLTVSDKDGEEFECMACGKNTGQRQNWIYDN